MSADHDRRTADDHLVAAVRRVGAVLPVLRQGAVGTVAVIERDGRLLVEKRMTDPVQHRTEVLALRALATSGLPVPELVDETPGRIVMTFLTGERLDDLDAAARRRATVASVPLLRALHGLSVPDGLPTAPDDDRTIERYHSAGGPPLPWRHPAAGPAVFCHGDWTAGNLLAVDGTITGVLDWEAAFVGDPVRELARIAWSAEREDPGAGPAITAAYGADPAAVRAWMPVHAAELWLWFTEAGPPEYLARLTAELERWPA